MQISFVYLVSQADCLSPSTKRHNMTKSILVYLRRYRYTDIGFLYSCEPGRLLDPKYKRLKV